MKVLYESPECYIQQCNKCGAVLRYSRNDIYISYIEHRFDDGSSWTFATDHIQCPVCKEFIFATKELVCCNFPLKNT